MNNNKIALLKAIFTKAYPLDDGDNEEKVDDLMYELSDCYHTYTHLIFDHSFAKAFWGEELCTKVRIREGIKMKRDVTAAINPQILDYYATTGEFYMWQYHLQQMVLEEEPLKYLERFL